MSSHSFNARAVNDYGPLVQSRSSRLITKLVIAVFFCGIFEGAMRKWFIPASIPELSYIAYLSKFIAFWIVCFAIAAPATQSRSQLEYRAYLQAGLILWACGAMLSAVGGFSITGGFLTIVMTVAAPLFTYLATSNLRGANMHMVLKSIALMAIVPAILGLIQFDLPPNHVLNKYLGDHKWTEVISALGRVRATGTFSFISGMLAMTVVCIWAGLCLRTISEKFQDQILGLVAVIAGFVCGFAALSRGAIFMGLALLAMRLFAFGRDRQILVIIIIGALGYTYLSVDLPRNRSGADISLTSGVFVRHSRSDSVSDRFSSWGIQLLDASEKVPLGNGFGLNQIGGRAVEIGRRELVTYEAELARLVAEIGVPGLIGVLVIRIGLLLALFHAWQRMPASPTRNAVLISIATVGLFFVGNTAFDHVAAGFVWPIAAIALAWASNGERANATR